MTRVRSCPSGWAVVRSSHDPVVHAVIEHGIPGGWSIAHSTSIRSELQEEAPSEWTVRPIRQRGA